MSLDNKKDNFNFIKISQGGKEDEKEETTTKINYHNIREIFSKLNEEGLKIIQIKGKLISLKFYLNLNFGRIRKNNDQFRD